MYRRIEIEFHGRPLSIEVGRMAKQADGAALVSYGETVLLVTAVAARTGREGLDFFPLTCDYQERTFADANWIIPELTGCIKQCHHILRGNIGLDVVHRTQYESSAWSQIMNAVFNLRDDILNRSVL